MKSSTLFHLMDPDPTAVHARISEGSVFLNVDAGLGAMLTLSAKPEDMFQLLRVMREAVLDAVAEDAGRDDRKRPALSAVVTR